MKTPKHLVETCNTFIEHYDALEEYFDRYLFERPSNKNAVIKFINALDDWLSDTEEYIQALISQFSDSLVLTNPKAIGQMLSMFTDELSKELQDVLSFWKERPAFYCSFTIKKNLSKDLFEIEDILTGDTYHLYSPEIQSLQEKQDSRDATYLALVMSNGECLQAMGMLHFNRLNAEDITFLCHVIDKATFDVAGLTGVLTSHPMGLYYFDFQAPTQEIEYKGHTLAIWYASFKKVTYTFDQHFWIHDNRGKVASYTLANASDAMRAVSSNDSLWEDLSYAGMRVFKLNGEWIVLAQYREAFDVLVHLLGLEEPEKVARVTLSLALHLERNETGLPWSPFTLIPWREMKPMQDEDEMEEAWNTFFGEFVEAYNNGKPFDYKKEALQLRIDHEMAKDFIEQFEKKRDFPSYEVSEEDAQYRLKDWPVPSPAKRNQFLDGMIDSNLFLLQDTWDTEDAFNELSSNQWKNEIEELGLFGFIEDAFIEAFETDEGYVALNVFFWILLHMSEQKILVRSIALETFCLFPYLQATYDFDAFVKILGPLIYDLFCRTSLCRITHRVKREERERGLYTVQASSFLLSIIRPTA